MRTCDRLLKVYFYWGSGLILNKMKKATGTVGKLNFKLSKTTLIGNLSEKLSLTNM